MNPQRPADPGYNPVRKTAYQAGQSHPLVVAYRNGQPVRLQELGNVRDSVENDRVAAWFATPTTRSRAIILAIQRQPGTNTIQVADAVKALLPAFREKLPASVSLVVLRDSSLPIKESARDVQFTLYMTMLLVVLVSGFVSLTLTPMPSSRFLHAPGREWHGRSYRFVETGFDAMFKFYSRTLLWVLSHGRTTRSL